VCLKNKKVINSRPITSEAGLSVGNNIILFNEPSEYFIDHCFKKFAGNTSKRNQTKDIGVIDGWSGFLIGMIIELRQTSGNFCVF
jgi:hypothetical protein